MTEARKTETQLTPGRSGRLPCRLSSWLLLLAWGTTFTLCAQEQATRRVTVPAPSSSQHVRRALVIGNRDYVRLPLTNTIHDATDVSGILRTLGFQTELVTDANLVNLNKAVNAFAQSLDAGDFGFFYYSGHGFQLDSTNYLVPVDYIGRTEDEARRQAVSFDAIKGQLEGKKTDGLIMVIDACRDNPFHPASGPVAGMAETQAGLGSYIVFAASPGQTASDNPRDRNGLFTKFLLESLKEKVNVSELFRRVRKRVKDASDPEQLPYLHDQMIADFYLNGSDKTEEAALSKSPVGQDEQEAKQMYHEGRCEPAIEILNRVVRNRPTDPFVQNSTGLAYACLSMSKPAAEHFSLAIELKPDYAAPYVNRGNVFLTAGQYTLALEDFNWAIEQEPENAGFYSRRGQAWFGLMRYQEAGADYLKATQLDPSGAHGYYGRGKVAHQMGQYQEALKQFNAAISLNHLLMEAYVDRARTRERLGDSTGAEGDRRAASALRH